MTGNMGHKSREKNCLLQECVQDSRVDRDDSATHHEAPNDACQIQGYAEKEW